MFQLVRTAAAFRPRVLGATLLVVALFAALGTSAASARAGHVRVAAALPLSHALRANGTLRHVSGSFDARGYRLVLGRHGAPRFLRSGTGAGAATSASPAGANPLTTNPDSLWSENFGMVGLGSSNVGLYAVAVSGSKIYIGGAFGKFGYDASVTYNNVAMWDGHGWHPMGSGITGGSAQVYAIALVGADVFVGGSFSTAGGQPVNNVAMWNPTSGWSPLAGGITQGTGVAPVYALAATGTASSPTVYAGGYFTTAGTQPANDVAVWNGTAWGPLGSGLTGGSDKVTALVLAGSTLYAGGSFSTSGSQHMNSIAAWNGSNWNSVGGAGLSTTFGGPGGVNALVYNAATGTLYAGGSFQMAGGTFGSGGVATGGTSVSNVAQFDGTSWSPVGTGVSQTVGGLAFWNGKLYASYSASDTPSITVWNGTSWAPIGQALAGASTVGPVLEAFPGGVVAGGEISTAANGTILLDGLGLWNGSTWKGYGLGIGGSIWGLAASNHDLYAVGGFSYAGQTEAINVAHFNGTNSTWSSLGSAGIVGTGGACGAQGVLFNICAVAIDPVSHHLFIGGSFSSINGVPAANVAMWNGSSWQALGQGTDGTVNALLVYNGKLYAGGRFQHADGNPASDVAQWNLTGGGWTALGDDPTFVDNANSWSDVDSLAGVTQSPNNHYVIIGGGFPYLSDGTNDYYYNGLAAFDTSRTSYASPLDGFLYFPDNTGLGSTDGTNNAVFAIYVDATKIYVGGNFTSAGGLSSPGFAMYDMAGASGSQWSAPGSVSGGSSEVFAITKTGSSLYLAGSFTGAGGVAANNIAQYTPGATTPWAALGSGITGPSFPIVYGLAPSADGLYAAGSGIGSAGAATPSAGLGLWTGTAFTLSAAETVSPTATSVGSPVTFTVTVKNTATTTASGVSISNAFPSSATFDSGSPSCTQTSAGAVKCSIGSLAPGASATETLTLTPNATGYLSNNVNARESGSSYTAYATARAKVS